MNRDRIAMIAKTMENYAVLLRYGVIDENEDVIDEAFDGIARTIERLEALGVVVERKR